MKKNQGDISVFKDNSNFIFSISSIVNLVDLEMIVIGTPFLRSSTAISFFSSIFPLIIPSIIPSSRTESNEFFKSR